MKVSRPRTVAWERSDTRAAARVSGESRVPAQEGCVPRKAIGGDLQDSVDSGIGEICLRSDRQISIQNGRHSSAFRTATPMFPAKEATSPPTDLRDSAPTSPHPSEPLPPRSPCLASPRPTRPERVPRQASARALPSTVAPRTPSGPGISAWHAVVSGFSTVSPRQR